MPNTPNTLVRFIGALVQRRDSEIQVVTVPENSLTVRQRLKATRIKIEASKHVTDLVANGVTILETRPRNHTFTSEYSHTNIFSL